MFINHTNKEDTLRRPDGTFIVIPPYSYCLLRGNVAHFGTGNSDDDAIFKFFCYLDPVQYYRATNKYKDSVFLFNEYKNIVRSKVTPFAVVLDTGIVPYLCVYCHEQFYYTYPMCTHCMLSQWKLKVAVDNATHSTKYTNEGKKSLEAGHVFPDAFQKGFMTSEAFAKKYPSLAGETIAHIRASATHVQNFLEYKSLLSGMKMHEHQFNTVLEYDEVEKVGYLKVVKLIEKREEIVVKGTPCAESNHFVVDIDEYSLKAVLDEDEEEGEIFRSAFHSQSSELEEALEIDGDDGLHYDEDEEFADSDDEDDESV